jgi:hypothetical protein
MHHIALSSSNAAMRNLSVSARIHPDIVGTAPAGGRSGHLISEVTHSPGVALGRGFGSR